MPNNPYVVGTKLAGDEISSTYEGRHLTFLESELTHPDHTVGAVNLVQKGDPVCIGGGVANEKGLVGVALNTALTANDLITIDTEGIWVLNVKSDVYAIVVGMRLYINYVAAEVNRSSGNAPFGYALSTLTASTTGKVTVKVHAD